MTAGAGSPPALASIEGALASATKLAGEFERLLGLGDHAGAFAWLTAQFPSAAAGLEQAALRLGVAALTTGVGPLLLFALAGGALLVFGKPADVATYKPWADSAAPDDRQE